ncbi:MAG: GH3 auxin-responsive promoter family protein [Phycisphaerae bacterium]|jgi:hypothetical protein
MPERPSIADRLMCLAARAHARHVYRRFLAATRRAAAVQERVLLAKIRRNADSGFGRDFAFDRIHSITDFVRRVPILRYEDHAPYVERVKAGDARALLGPGQRVLMFALTSGTTDQPKYIPVTDAFLKEYRAGWNAFGIKALLDHPAAMLRGIVQVTSRMDESRSAGGIPCGAITGLMAATQKRLVRKYYLTPACLARITDPEAKYYTIMRLAVPRDAAFLITASPATQLKLARAADEHREALVRDVRDGTLRADLDVPADVRAELAPRLRPDPPAARRLEELVQRHGRLLPRHYWNLAFLANWTGGTMGLYLREFPEYFGDVPVRDIGLLASEGRVSIPVQDGTPAGILDVASHFFEFVPRDQMEAAAPRTLRCHELDVGQEYFVLLTTSSSLYRYDLGDLVRVTGYEGQAPVIEFLNKGAHTCSLSGEKLTEHQVVQAMREATRCLGLPAVGFILAPRWGRPPGYVLHLEGDDDRPNGSPARLAAELDRWLCEVNIEYASRRRTDRLAPPRVNLLPAGFLARWDLEQAESRRPGNEQYKHRYLFTRPDEDECFPERLVPPILAPQTHRV